MFNPLTVAQLHQALTDLIARNPHSVNHTVVVPTDDISIGPHSTVAVVTILEGFDWDTGKLFLQLKQPVKKV